MNKNRREKIRMAASHLINIQGTVDQIADEERDSFDFLPENFQETERGEKMQDAISALEDVSELIGTAIDRLEEAME